MSFSKKLSIAFGVLMLLIAALGGVFFFVADSVDKQANSLVIDSLPGVYSLGKLQKLGTNIDLLMLTHINSVEPREMDEIEKSLANAEQSFRDQIKAYSVFYQAPEEQRMFVRLTPAMNRIMTGWAKIRMLSRSNRNPEAMSLFRQTVAPETAKLGEYLQEEYDYNKQNADQIVSAFLRTAAYARTLSYSLPLIALLVGVVLATYLTRDLVRRLHRAIHMLSEGTQEIHAAAAQVASGSQGLAERATAQAASLQETSASSQQISAMTQRNMQSSATTASLMKEVDLSITEANQKLNQLALGMREIGDASSQIATIIKVIDEIAFQTNILALNAAVEAARAGEAGLGFAVVADEVRTLAQRCAQATKDIGSVIDTSVSSARNGNGRLTEVTKVVAEMTERTGRVKTLVEEVHLGGAEQARGVEQISKALVHMEQITQQVAANAEEAASASEELNGQARAMSNVVKDLEVVVSGQHKQ